MGAGFMVNRSLVDLFETGVSGLVLKDRECRSATRRDFHLMACKATTVVEDGVRKIRPGMLLFMYLFVLGELVSNCY